MMSSPFHVAADGIVDMPLRKTDEERQAAQERHQREKEQRTAEQKQAHE